MLIKIAPHPPSMIPKRKSVSSVYLSTTGTFFFFSHRKNKVLSFGRYLSLEVEVEVEVDGGMYLGR
jgi:hypothetical protein